MTITNLWRLARALALSLATLAGLASCGGGGVAGVGSGGTGSFAFGPIAGFGSVIVGGIRYDDSQALVLDDDDAPIPGTALALGMVVEVTGSALTPASPGGIFSREGRADRIRVETAVIGPLDAVDPAQGVLRVFGQHVVVATGTVFGPGLEGGLTALASLPTGTVLEVHAFVEAIQSGRYTATRIALAGSPSAWRLRGIVRDLDPGTRTFFIGDTRLSYAGHDAQAQAVGLANGLLVRVRVSPVPASAGTWAVDRLRSGQRAVEDHDDVEIEGRITRFASPFDFDVEGLPVDARTAAFDDDPARLALGVQVEVEGRIRGGVLIAREVEIEDDDDDDRGTVSLEGRIGQLDLQARTFVLRGYLVRYGPATRFDDGSEADLANDVEVEVQGRIAADGAIDAFEIEFDD